MADMIITNQTANPYTFGPYQLAGGLGNTVTIDTTTNASLYLTQDSFADAVNALYALGYIIVSNQPIPFPRVTGVPQLLHGDGSPEGVVFATSGSAFMRRDNSGAGNALYAKTTGLSLSTGWQAFSGLTIATPATTLPGSPSNGEQAILTDSTSAPTYNWLLQWNSTASKWMFLGGSPYFKSDSTHSLTYSAGGSWTDLSATLTGIPKFTVSRAGTYLVEFACTGADSSGAGHLLTSATIKNGTPTGITSIVESLSTATTGRIIGSDVFTCVASDTLGVGVSCGVNGVVFSQATLTVTPMEL